MYANIFYPGACIHLSTCFWFSFLLTENYWERSRERILGQMFHSIFLTFSKVKLLHEKYVFHVWVSLMGRCIDAVLIGPNLFKKEIFLLINLICNQINCILHFVWNVWTNIISIEINVNRFGFINRLLLSWLSGKECALIETDHTRHAATVLFGHKTVPVIWCVHRN